MRESGVVMYDVRMGVGPAIVDVLESAEVKDAAVGSLDRWSRSLGAGPKV